MLSRVPSGILSFGFLVCAGWPEICSPASAAELSKAIAVGAKVPRSNSLRDLHGNRRPLHDFKGYSAVVVAFLGTDCPITNLYLPQLLELEKKYRPRHVQFLAVYPNEGEDLDQVAAHASDRNVPFPVLKDFGQGLVDALGVTRLPTVAIVDDDFVLRYRGRIDDRCAVASRKPKATRDDLAQAIEEVLAGKKTSVPETEADGCLLDRGAKQVAQSDVTYTKNVAGILQKHCQACHRPDQAAPFPLVSYDDATRHGRMIKEVTTQRRMPPWHADPRYGHFRNDRRLTRDEIDTLATWVDAGMPRGNDKDLPKPIDWPTGWSLGKPDLVISMPEEFTVPADGLLPYKTWEVASGFTEDKWVRVAEARPGAPSVVHHLVVYILPEGEKDPFKEDGTLSILVGWAPGDLGLVCPPDTAMRVPKKSRLRFELHYTPNGKSVKDRSSVGITFAERPPKFELFTNSFANETILVPPHDPHYRAEATLRLPADARIISFVPHMHWRGKDYFFEVIYADGKREPLLSVPRYDFNWQNVYRFQEPLKLPKGARVHAVAHWDNSRNNPLNPAPDKKVPFGLQTFDEMMVGWTAYVWERPETPEELRKNPPSQADLFFDRFDRNGDDFVTPDEIPAEMLPLLKLSGKKLPDKMTREQFRKIFRDMSMYFDPDDKPKRKRGGGANKPQGAVAPRRP